MCTMDYVSHVLSLQGWERAYDEEAYFGGWETDDIDDEKVSTHTRQVFRPDSRRKQMSKGCQTPKEWLTLSPPEEVKEAVPRDAPVRVKRLRPGTTPPTGPQPHNPLAASL